MHGIKGYLAWTMGFQNVFVESVEESMAKADELEGKDGFDRKTLEVAEPGAPSFAFYNTKQ